MTTIPSNPDQDPQIIEPGGPVSPGEDPGGLPPEPEPQPEPAVVPPG